MNHSQRLFRLLSTAFFIFLMLCNTASAQTFGSLTKFTNTWSPGTGQLRDLNADGIPDLITTASNTIYIRTGNGTGGFNTTPVTLSNTSGGLTSVAVADFDGDGRQDIAVTQPLAGPPVLVFFRNTSNSPLTFAAASTRTVGSSDFSTAPNTIAGDFNNDGRLDVAISAYDNVLIYLNSGTGTTAATRFPGVSGNPNATLTGFIEVFGILAGDINNDAKTDLIVETPTGGSIRVNTTTGATPTFSTAMVSYSPRLLANVNGDANLDIVSTNFSNTVSVYLGNGAGAFGAANNFTISPTNGLTTGDYNGDGRTDIATVGQNASFVPVISVLRNTGNSPLAFTNAGISTVTASNINTSSIELLTGDLNGDGRPDIVSVDQDFSASPGDNGAKVILNSTLAATPTNPSGVTLTPIGTSMNGSFTGSGATGYLVLRRLTSVSATAPVDGTTYTVGSTYASQRVVSAGAATSFTRLKSARVS